MQESHQDLEKLRKELRMTRIFSGITSILLICVLIGVFIAFSKIQEYMTAVMPLVEKMLFQLEQLDMDALNDAITGLNTEELTKALENFNDSVEALESFSGSVKDFFSKFGGGIKFGGF